MLWINTLQLFSAGKTYEQSPPYEDLSYRDELLTIDQPDSRGSSYRIYLDDFFMERLALKTEKDISSTFEIRQNTICLYFILEGNFEITFTQCPFKKLTQGFHNVCYLPASSGCLKCPCGKYEVLYITVPTTSFKDFLPGEQALFDHFIKNIQQEKGTVLRKEPGYINAKIYKIIEEICSYNGDEHFKKIFTKAKIIELITIQLQQLCQKCTPSPPIQKESVEKMYRARDFMLKHLGEYHSLGTLAKIAGTNEYTLKKEFKELFGETVFGFWNEVKMEKAQELLLENQKSVKEISEIIGYKNPQHFSTAFKRRFRITPSEFRKEQL